MNFNHLDAQALNTSGGPIDALAAAIDRAATGYFRNKDRQGEREMQRGRLDRDDRLRREEWKRRLNLQGFDDEASMLEDAKATREINKRLAGFNLTKAEREEAIAAALAPSQERNALEKSDLDFQAIQDQQNVLSEAPVLRQRKLTQDTGFIPEPLRITDARIPLRASDEMQILQGIKQTRDEGRLDQQAKREALLDRGDDAEDRALAADATRILTSDGMDVTDEDRELARAFLTSRLQRRGGGIAPPRQAPPKAYPEGTVIKNPTTGERKKMVGGNWVPVK